MFYNYGNCIKPTNPQQICWTTHSIYIKWDRDCSEVPDRKKPGYFQYSGEGEGIGDDCQVWLSSSFHHLKKFSFFGRCHWRLGYLLVLYLHPNIYKRDCRKASNSSSISIHERKLSQILQQDRIQYIISANVKNIKEWLINLITYLFGISF